MKRCQKCLIEKDEEEFSWRWKALGKRDDICKECRKVYNKTYFNGPAFGNVVYNLPFLLAFDVLKRALLRAKDEGCFTGSRRHLGGLMESAKTALPWNDWQGLREAVKRQSEVARIGKLLGDIQCLQDIANIEAQLVAWGVISPYPS